MKHIRYFSLIAAVLIMAFTGATAFAGNIVSKEQNKKIKISGVVTDSNLNPIGGVRIFVDQVYANSVTNSKGFYRIKVAPTAKQISAFSSLYGVQKIEIQSDLTAVGNAVINIMLVEINANLIDTPQDSTEGVDGQLIEKAQTDDEMINIGYGSINKKNLTTEVNKIDAHSRYQTYSNVYDMIRGEVPGVEVIGNTIRIRDAFSFYLTTEPLIVVDGVINSQLDGLSPSDVKSIEILKGASATVYGARGGNGVILVTTMKGGDE